MSIQEKETLEVIRIRIAHQKGKCKKMDRQVTDKEKIVSKHISEKGLVFLLPNNKTNSLIKNGQKI